MSYPTDRWQRLWFDWGSGKDDFSAGVYKGNTPEESNGKFDNDWGGGTIAYGKSDRIKFQSSRSIYLSAGTYGFTVGSDDGIRLWIDDTLVIDQWGDDSYRRRSSRNIFGASGWHRLRIDYYENSGDARASFRYDNAPCDESSDNCEVTCNGAGTSTYTSRYYGENYMIAQGDVNSLYGTVGWWKFTLNERTHIAIATHPEAGLDSQLRVSTQPLESWLDICSGYGSGQGVSDWCDATLNSGTYYIKIAVQHGGSTPNTVGFDYPTLGCEPEEWTRTCKAADCINSPVGRQNAIYEKSDSADGGVASCIIGPSTSQVNAPISPWEGVTCTGGFTHKPYSYDASKPRAVMDKACPPASVSQNFADGTECHVRLPCASGTNVVGSGACWQSNDIRDGRWDDSQDQCVACSGATETTAYAKAGDYVIVYQDANYGGQAEVFVADDPDLETNFPNIHGRALCPSCGISSVKASGCTVTLYDGKGYGGSSILISSNVADLSPLNFNDISSSLKVSCNSPGAIYSKCTPSDLDITDRCESACGAASACDEKNVGECTTATSIQKCSSTCSVVPSCGDGTVNCGEECEPPSTTTCTLANGDAGRKTCSPTCGWGDCRPTCLTNSDCGVGRCCLRHTTPPEASGPLAGQTTNEAGRCIGKQVYALNSAFLCDPGTWIICDESKVGSKQEFDSRVFVCTKENGIFKWEEKTVAQSNPNQDSAFNIWAEIVRLFAIFIF